MVSGIHLLSIHLYSDSFIIWRSLIESISYYKILSVSDQKTANLFITRRDDTAKIIGLVPASKAEMASISSQIENRKNGKKCFLVGKATLSHGQEKSLLRPIPPLSY